MKETFTQRRRSKHHTVVLRPAMALLFIVGLLVSLVPAVTASAESSERLLDGTGTSTTLTAELAERLAAQAVDLSGNEVRIAYNSTDNEYMVVWERNYGTNENGVEEWRIVAARVGLQGELLSQPDEIIRYGRRPDIAYNPNWNQYLIVADGLVDQNGNSDLSDDTQEIYGFVLANDGSIVSPVLRISAMQAQRTDIVRPLAYNARIAVNTALNEYMVVWEGYVEVNDPANYQINSEAYVQRLAATGEAIGGSIQVSQMRETYQAETSGIYATTQTPTIAYNSAQNEYLVVWDGNAAFTPTRNLSDQRGEELALSSEVFAQRLAADGSEVGGDFRVSLTGFDADPGDWVGKPEISYSPSTNQYMVVWFYFINSEPPAGVPFDPATRNGIGARLITGNGDMATDPYAISYYRSVEFAGETFNLWTIRPKVTWNAQSDRFVVMWQDVYGYVFAQLFAPDGTPASESIEIADLPITNNRYFTTSIASSNTNYFLVAWTPEFQVQWDWWRITGPSDGA